MKKAWLVFKHEYLRRLLTKRFLFAVLSLPIGILIFFIMTVAIAFMQSNSTPIGYIDLSDTIPTGYQPDAAIISLFPAVEMRRMPDEDEARRALEAGEVQAYFVLPPDYFQSGKVREVGLSSISSDAESSFRTFLLKALLKDQPPELAKRVGHAPTITVRAVDGSRSMATDQLFGMLIPLFGGLLLMLVINTSGGYLLQALVEEKENRTMEIVVTSISPTQLMAGKTLGNISLGLTQMVIWLMLIVLPGVILKQVLFADVSLGLTKAYLPLTMAVFLPAFVMIASLMAAVGASVTDQREAQQVAGLFTLPIFVPYWFISAIMINPNSPLAVGLSLFPLTAPVTLPLRAAFTTVPAWQIAVSLGLLVSLAIASLWFAGRVFRLGMLRYGKRLSWKEMFARGG